LVQLVVRLESFDLVRLMNTYEWVISRNRDHNLAAIFPRTKSAVSSCAKALRRGSNRNKSCQRLGIPCAARDCPSLRVSCHYH